MCVYRIGLDAAKLEIDSIRNSLQNEEQRTSEAESSLSRALDDLSASAMECGNLRDQLESTKADNLQREGIESTSLNQCRSELKAMQLDLEASQAQATSMQPELQRTIHSLSEAETRVLESECQRSTSAQEAAILRDELNVALAKATSLDQNVQARISELSNLKQLEADLLSQLEVSKIHCIALEGQLVVSQSNCVALEGQLNVLKGSFDAEREAASSSAASMRSELDAIVQQKIRDVETISEVRQTLSQDSIIHSRRMLQNLLSYWVSF